MCGRLRCCLVYEYEQYVEARKTLPKRGKKVVSNLGEGKVVDTFPLKQSVLVQLGDGKRYEFMKHELEPWDELEALRRKSEAPCDRHENGECDCGKAGNKEAQAPPKSEADARLEQELEDEVNQTIGYQNEAARSQSPQSESSTGEGSHSKRQGKSRRNKGSRSSQSGSSPDRQGGDQGKRKRKPRRPSRRKDSGSKPSN